MKKLTAIFLMGARNILYGAVLFITLLVAYGLPHAAVKSFFENRRVVSDNKKVTEELLDLGAREDEIRELKTKIKNHKNGLDDLWDEKSFRSIVLRNAVSQMNKQNPTKIDELTYLIEATTDGDRTISYKFRADTTYDEGKKIFDNYKDVLRQDRIKYWCHDDRAIEFRKMKATAVYEYFSKDMLPIGNYLIDINQEC